MTDRQSTHGHDCWGWGPKHYECAVREIERLRKDAAREDGWQPIETAPKDGTRVLLWFEWHDLPVVGDFRHGRWWSVHSLGGNLTRPNGMDWEEVMKPAYWRPLPEPPATALLRDQEENHENTARAALAHGGEG